MNVHIIGMMDFGLCVCVCVFFLESTDLSIVDLRRKKILFVHFILYTLSFVQCVGNLSPHLANIPFSLIISDLVCVWATFCSVKLTDLHWNYLWNNTKKNIIPFFCFVFHNWKIPHAGCFILLVRKMTYIRIYFE